MNDSGGILQVWRDLKIRSAAEQMSVDERLLHGSEVPFLRFYQWNKPAVTIGYFLSEKAAAAAHPGLEIARRRTGGGIVEHGDDVTFALTVPRAAAESQFGALLKAPASERYRWIHERLAGALRSSGIDAIMVDAEPSVSPGTADPGRCFAAPVISDVVDPETGRKIAGGAQRRSREGWLHQGSVRLDSPHNRIDADWTQAFCEEVAGAFEVRECEGFPF